MERGGRLYKAVVPLDLFIVLCSSARTTGKWLQTSTEVENPGHQATSQTESVAVASVLIPLETSLVHVVTAHVLNMIELIDAGQHNASAERANYGTSHRASDLNQSRRKVGELENEIEAFI